MTNKEAIKLIQEIEEDGRNVTNKHIEALNLAIKALEFQSNIKEACDCSCGFELTEYIRREVRKYDRYRSI